MGRSGGLCKITEPARWKTMEEDARRNDATRACLRERGCSDTDDGLDCPSRRSNRHHSHSAFARPEYHSPEEKNCSGYCDSSCTGRTSEEEGSSGSTTTAANPTHRSRSAAYEGLPMCCLSSRGGCRWFGLMFVMQANCASPLLCYSGKS